MAEGAEAFEDDLALGLPVHRRRSADDGRIGGRGVRSLGGGRKGNEATSDENGRRPAEAARTGERHTAMQKTKDGGARFERYPSQQRSVPPGQSAMVVRIKGRQRGAVEKVY